MSRLPPTGTVTLLLADVEESTHLWQMCPEDMATAIAHLDHTVSEAITNHGGVQPVKRYEGDSFVAAFTRASDAAACALDLQRTSLAPIRLRIGLHTGEVQLRDELYVGPTINRTARLRDLAHGGQVVLSAATGDLVTGRLPADAWLVDLGRHPLRGLPQPRLRAPWVCPISRAVQPWIVFADSSAIAACSWCWTTVNIFSMRAQRWSLSYWGPVRS